MGTKNFSYGIWPGTKTGIICKIVFVILFLIVTIPIADARDLDKPSMSYRGYDKHNREFIKKYISTNKGNLTAVKKRSGHALHLIDSVFKSDKLPGQLKYLAVVESELKTKAVSKAGAAGPWQLMPETAKILGLKVSAHHDDRLNLIKSTRAAALHLKGLHEEFPDWLLSIAGYNCGDLTVYNAIKNAGSSNYWAVKKYLPKETQEYVAKYLATCYFFDGGCNFASR
ncbi:MAG TPA: lytic transglycosylase domain-containing protein [Puia sp.]|nr:lytic transglycosylase domain-containing protein [Puia sp.]